MGGYGGSSGNVKDKCYYDTGGHKVTDKNAIEVAEQYMSEGKYVAFLQQHPPDKNADLAVEGVYTEVKGMDSTKSNKVRNNIHRAFDQIESGLSRYPQNERKPGKVIILSRHDNFEAVKLGGGEYYELTVYAWKCSECGTFAFFDQRGKVTGVYKPTKEFSSEPTEFG